MSTPEEMGLIEKIVLLQFVLDQHRWLILVLLARCGGEAKVTKEELDFVMKSYEMDEVISSHAHTVEDVYLKLSLKA